VRQVQQIDHGVPIQSAVVGGFVLVRRDKVVRLAELLAPQIGPVAGDAISKSEPSDRAVNR
jgi:hypothetical protein